jgi:hypothetical protein
MLTTQFNGTTYGGLGALMSSAGITDLQRYLVSIGKLSSSSVTGVMNDATMGVVFNLLIESAGTVGKIPLLPGSIRDGINAVVGALKSADSKIKSISFGQASLSTVIRNWATINAAVRLISGSAADAMASAREAVYNAVGGQASIIKQAVAIFFPPATPAQASPAAMTALPNLSVMTAFLQPTKAGTTAVPAAAASATVPGTIYAWSPKLGRYRVAVPRQYGGGFGIMETGLMGDCVFGDCGLGATAAPYTETAPVATPPAGGTSTTESDLEKKTGTAPFYKKWPFWAAVGGGVAVIGTGTALLMRRKRSA